MGAECGNSDPATVCDNSCQETRATNAVYERQGGDILKTGGEPLWLSVSSPCNASVPCLAEPVNIHQQQGCDVDEQRGDVVSRVVTPQGSLQDDVSIIHSERCQKTVDNCGNTERRVDSPTWWSFCACCKRPLTISIADLPRNKRARQVVDDDCQPLTVEKFAWVVAIWGTNMEYVLGALVLGHSLRAVGSKHDLVAMHSDDVPEGALEFLRRGGWTLRKVDHVEAAETLFQPQCLKMRFARVFTKLRLFELVEYSKIAMLDADLLVTRNIDDIFNLSAPAAMIRGPWAGYEHGEKIDGRCFFAGSRPGPWSWGQSCGINAGVMLLEPSLATLAQCLEEVADPLHPEHVRGNGPEQDYLSRFFANSWHHLDVSYNFQLHQMYFALSPTSEGADRAKFLHRPEEIKVFHYSSDPKPWARHLDAELGKLSYDEWIEMIKQNFSGYKAWVLGDKYYMEKEMDRSSGYFEIGPDDKVHRVEWAKPKQSDFDGQKVAGSTSTTLETEIPNGLETAASCGSELEVTRVESSGPTVADESEPSIHNSPTRDPVKEGVLLGEALEPDPVAIRGAEEVTLFAIRRWDETYESLAKFLGEADLASSVMAAARKDIGCDINAENKDCEKESWKPVGGWWVEKPLRSRAVASCIMLPKPCAVLSFDGKELLCSDRPGYLHVAAVSAGSEALPAPTSFAFDPTHADVHAEDALEETANLVKQWVGEIPDGTTVLTAAILNPDRLGPQIAETEGRLRCLLEALADGGLGSPREPPPAGYVVLAAAGQKGMGRWSSTHAAYDVALATTIVQTPTPEARNDV